MDNKQGKGYKKIKTKVMCVSLGSTNKTDRHTNEH